MKNEQERLQELYSYKVLDTAPEKELDEIAELASVICGTPISLISMVDAQRQWFKAEKGLGVKETPREHAFCDHALHNPMEVLVVDDPLNDQRFKENPLVLGYPEIRFYAGAPLTTVHGNVLGTLCIIDNKPRTISEDQKKGLQILAKKAMDYLETRKVVLEQGNRIESDAARLKNLTDQVPGAIYQFELKPDGTTSIPFVSKGISDINSCLTPEKLMQNPDLIFTITHPDDVQLVRSCMNASMKNTNYLGIEFRVVSHENRISWVSLNARPQVQDDGTVVWYGTFRDITDKKNYVQTLEQILFDISHVMRRPVANMLGLVKAMQEQKMDRNTLKDYTDHLMRASQEMDTFIRKLNSGYSELRKEAKK